MVIRRARVQQTNKLSATSWQSTVATNLAAAPSNQLQKYSKYSRPTAHNESPVGAEWSKRYCRAIEPPPPTPAAAATAAAVADAPTINSRPISAVSVVSSASRVHLGLQFEADVRRECKSGKFYARRLSVKVNTSC